MYPGPPERESPGAQVELDVAAAVHEEVLPDGAGGAAEPDTGDVVVVEAGALPGHPREHPGVHPLVLADQLVPPVLGIRAYEGLPDVATLDDVDRDLLELLG